MLKIWGRRSSANVQKVMWLVGELAIPHEHMPAGGPYGLVNEPKFRAMNPNGLVPVIDDDGLILWESNAVVRYLAARYGGEDWWPSDPRKRAVMDQWMDWSATTFQPEINGAFWAYWRTPEHQRDWDKIKYFEQRCERALRLLDAELERRPYVAGDQFSVADIPSGVHLYRLYTLGRPVPHLENIEAWYRRLEARPAYARHVMVSYEELRGKLTF
jgi:glutathione S-transferase